MRIFKMIPMTVIPLIMFNMIAFGSGMDGSLWDETLFQIPMLSGVSWEISWSAIIIFVALIMLFFELLKATRFGSATILDHLLSMSVFVIYLIEFLLFDVSGGTSILFLLMIISALDVAAGFSISIRTAQRDVAFAPGTGLNGG